MRLYKYKLLFLTVMLLAAASFADDGSDILRLQVIDPYADVHSGPGRGYPVLYAIEEGEFIDVLASRPGWYEVRAQNGRVGWVTASQISRTIQVSGEPADMPTVSFGDYLKNQWWIGFAAGMNTSGELDEADQWSATVGYRAISWLGIELEYGKAFASDVRADFYGVNIYYEPYSRWRLSPYVVFGAASLGFSKQPKIVEFDSVRESYQVYGAGANYYLGRNFLIKFEYRSSFSDVEINSNEGLGAWKIGFNTFF